MEISFAINGGTLNTIIFDMDWFIVAVAVFLNYYIQKKLRPAYFYRVFDSKEERCVGEVKYIGSYIIVILFMFFILWLF